MTIPASQSVEVVTTRHDIQAHRADDLRCGAAAFFNKLVATLQLGRVPPLECLPLN
jgi:hypothetical protein